MMPHASSSVAGMQPVALRRLGDGGASCWLRDYFASPDALIGHACWQRSRVPARPSLARCRAIDSMRFSDRGWECPLSHTAGSHAPHAAFILSTRWPTRTLHVHLAGSRLPYRD